METGIAMLERLKAIQDDFKERGWPDGTHGQPGHDYSDSDIRIQKIIGFGLLPVALLYCGSFLRSFSRRIDLDDSGVSTSWGQRMDFTAVTNLNKSRWKTKGIAVAHYDKPGKPGKLVLDNFKYDRGAINEMVKSLEAHLKPDQISGGQEPPPDELAE